jgi:hypothetical protein
MLEAAVLTLPHTSAISKQAFRALDEMEAGGFGG